MKKIRFLEVVEKSARYLRVRTPKVKFWKTWNKEHFYKGEMAHIHLDTNTICIAESYLHSMNFDDIKIVASHEVTHIYNETHNYAFQSLRVDVEAALWNPPRGTIGLPKKDDENIDSILSNLMEIMRKSPKVKEKKLTKKENIKQKEHFEKVLFNFVDKFEKEKEIII